jgi:hypothetical protein
MKALQNGQYESVLLYPEPNGEIREGVSEIDSGYELDDESEA